MDYYIQGCAANADKIKAAFEKLGYDVKNWRFTTGVYYSLNGRIVNTSIGSNEYKLILNNPDYKELELHIESKFKVGDWVVKEDGTTFYGGNYAEQITLIEVDEKERMWLSSKTWAHDDDIRLWSIADAKDGDVLATDNGWTCIFKAFDGCVFSSYCFMDSQKWFCEFGSEAHTPDSRLNGKIYPATKEQRDLLFAKMREAGYTWDEKKKELCKIIEPQFKVGDDIKTGNTIETIAEVDHDTRSYYCESGRTIYFANQDLWHLVPKPHYDIANFKPFDKVLVRQNDSCTWGVSFFGRCSGGMFMCCSNVWYEQCIPFEGNEHLLGTTDMPDERYINW